MKYIGILNMEVHGIEVYRSLFTCSEIKYCQRFVFKYIESKRIKAESEEFVQSPYVAASGIRTSDLPQSKAPNTTIQSTTLHMAD